ENYSSITLLQKYDIVRRLSYGLNIIHSEGKGCKADDRTTSEKVEIPTSRIYTFSEMPQPRNAELECDNQEIRYSQGGPQSADYKSVKPLPQHIDDHINEMLEYAKTKIWLLRMTVYYGDCAHFITYMYDDLMDS
ncbi:14065_t:CDS:2, partial [Dentiscutata erythropus]